MVGVNYRWSNSFTELSLYIMLLQIKFVGDLLIVVNEFCTVYIAVTEKVC